MSGSIFYIPTDLRLPSGFCPSTKGSELGRGIPPCGTPAPATTILAARKGSSCWKAWCNADSSSGTDLFLSRAGKNFVCDFGIDPDPTGLEAGTRCVACLDWSERKDHLAGKLGAVFVSRILTLKWAVRDKSSRAVFFTAKGRQEFDRLFPA